MSKDDDAWLASYDPTAFDRPSLAVDLAVLTVLGDRLHALLVRRENPPHQGMWACPGGFVGINESLRGAATRVLRDKGGLTGVFLEQLFTFGDPKRDPRTRVVSVAYVALLAADGFEVADRGRFFPLDVPWSGQTGGPIHPRDVSNQRLPLAFDHEDILGMAVKRIRGKLDYTPIGFQLLPETFTLRQLQRVHEAVLGTTVNKDSFRRRMIQSGQLEATGEREQEVGHRPAELYRFVQRSAI
ncbi:MAG: NUDIX domain-containing protein [Myxococcota bacterium]